MGSPKPSGIIKPSVPSKLAKNVDGKWPQANGNAMRGNRLIVRSWEKKYKKQEVCPPSVRPAIIMHCGQRQRRKRRRKQRGGILPFLIPAAIALGKAAALGAVSGAAGYGAKKGIQAATRKKKVGKISAAQWAANKRRVRQMLSRTGLPPLRTLGMV